MTKQDNNDPVVVKKYANRRLYNTQTSCYVVLEDLFDMIKRGEDFIVKDAKTEEDLTRSVLTQIIFEQEAKGYNLLPINFLRQLIGLYGKNNLDTMFPEYLSLSMENFVNNQEKLSQFSTDNFHDYHPMKMFETITRQNMEMFENTLNMFNPKKDD
jgi:polyhydroxyalkanoate synthesis repressor PhaR